MLAILLSVAVLLTAGQSQQTGIITGAVVTSGTEPISEPLQVILLPPKYRDLWSTEVQKRLDRYWQQYQQSLRTRRDLFTELSKQAHWDATLYVLTTMRRDPSSKFAEYFRETSADGKFEFTNVPFGEYRILAVGKIGNQEMMWQDSVEIQSAIPHFLELKKRVP